jgi:4-amino-4-deoxy-L-arabinose transferase-like glycosyltransferase
VLPLVFFTLSVGKQPRYILPVLPPLAVLLAGSIIERTRDWRSLDGSRVRPRPNRSVRLGSIGAAALLIALGGLLYRAQPLFLDVSRTTTIVTAAFIAVCGAVVLLISVTGAWRTAPAALAVAAALTFAVLPYGALAASQDATVRRLATAVRAARTSGEEVATYKVFVRNLVFYSGIKQTDLVHDDHLRDWLATTPRGLLVLRATDAARFAREHGARFEPLTTLPYFDEGGLRARTLLWPDPARDLEEVVLVRVTAR